jgi:hypothetical protein
MAMPGPAQLPEPRSKFRQRDLLFAGVGLLVGVLVTAVVSLAAGDSGYDEEAHHRAIEATGVSVADWPVYRDLVFESCEMSEDQFAFYITQTSESEWGRLQLDIFYACPDRISEFDEVMQIVN